MHADLNNTVLLGEQQKNDGKILSVILSVVLFFMVCLLGFVSFFGLCTVEGSSMNATLYHKDRVLVYKYPLKIYRGDIVIIAGNDDYPTLIKRVIALEGDTILFEKDRHINLDCYTVKLSIKKKGETGFTPCSEAYIMEEMEFFENDTSDIFYGLIGIPIEIPKKSVFVMGDNRNRSTDSRRYKAFLKRDILSKAFVRLTPGSFFENLMRQLFRDYEP